MARWYVLIGPYTTRDAATAESRKQASARVAKLRDRTGPSVAERLAAVEGDIRHIARTFDTMGEELETFGKRLDALEEHLRDHRTRIGDLELCWGESERDCPGYVKPEKEEATQ